MTKILMTLGLVGALSAAMTGLSVQAAEKDENKGSGHGDRITWPCPGTPTA